jgi:hypothetical protein
VLKGLLKEKFYNNFLVLSVALRILASPVQTDEYILYAEQLLNSFVTNFQDLYGKENVSYNVHGLIHLADDVRRHGDLNLFSAFKFENHLGKIKRLIKSHRLPLQQVHRRIIESETKATIVKENLVYPVFKTFKRKTGQENIQEFKEVQCKHYSLKTLKPNNCVLMKNGSIIYIESILNQDGGILIGLKFKSKADFFEFPCSSRLINIWETDNSISKKSKSWKLSDVHSKCLVIPSKSKLVIFPILHSRT